MESIEKHHNKVMVAGDNSIRDYEQYFELVNRITGADSFLNEMVNATSRIFEEVIPFDFTGNILEHGVLGANKRLHDTVKRERPEYIILACLLPPNYLLLQKTVSEIKNSGVITIGIFGDDTSQFDVYEKYWAYLLDFILVLDNPECSQNFDQLGAQALFTPVTTLPVRSPSFDGYSYDVSFIGAAAHGRKEAIDELADLGVTVTTFGSGWPAGEIDDETMRSVFSRSKINLNFSRTINGKTQIKGRIFNTCLCGGFLLTEYTPGIEGLFEIGKEIDCFKTIQEAKEKITYYLENERERIAIAERGYCRAAQYNYETQFRKLFTWIENGEITPNRDVRCPEPETAMIRQCQHMIASVALGFWLDKKDRKQAKEVLSLLSEWGIDNLTKRTRLIKFMITSCPRAATQKLLSLEQRLHIWVAGRKR